MLLKGCVLRVGVVGVNFKTADLPLRETLAKAAQNLIGEKGLFFPHPTIVLSTCNRTEIYFSGTDLAAIQTDILAFLRPWVDTPFEHRLYSYFGLDCLAHLCRVSSGLDSAILAETEIQHQVRVAYARASETRSLPSPLHYLVQKSLKVAKSLRSRLSQQKGPTLFSALYDLATHYLGDLKKKKILLVGYSELHRGLASYLHHQGISQFLFCTRTGTGDNRVGREILEQWSEYDWISCATTSDHYLIYGKSTKRHFISDLSVPRNVDPAVEGEDILLYNIEELAAMIERDVRDLRDIEAHLWESALRLTRLYREKLERASKIQHDRGSAGRGLHLEYFPCQ